MAFVSELDIEQILFRHDLMGLAALGAPADEYQPEAETIAPRLAEAGSVDDVSRILVEEFESWFTPEVAPPREALAAPAAEVWATLSR